MSTVDRLSNVFRESFALDDDADVANVAYREIPEWDSVAHMALVADIEDEFDVMLDTDQVIDMSSFSEAVRIVDSLLAADAG